MPGPAIFNHETVALDGEAFAGCEFRQIPVKSGLPSGVFGAGAVRAG